MAHARRRKVQRGPVCEALEPRLLMSNGVLIVTSEALAASFQQVSDWYTRKGYPAEVVSTETIASSYAGRDIQEKIRNSIIDYHDNHGVEYVLLGGDDLIVPDRNAYVKVGGYAESAMPTDLYYASLSGDWDTDGDSIFGEAGQDTVALQYDVIVGRYPIRTAGEVDTLFAKVLAYETAPPSSDWADQMLLTGTELWSTYGPDTYNGLVYDHTASDAEIKTLSADNWYVHPYWNNREIDTLFDSQSTWDTAGPGSYDLTIENLTAAMNQDYQFMHMATHGSYKSWAMESGSSFTSYLVDGLASQANVAIISTIACLTGGFDAVEQSVSEAFLRSANTSTIIYMGCSRYGWGYDSTWLGPSIRYSYRFYQEFLQNGYSIAGEAFAASKEAFVASSGIDGAYRWVQFGLNFQGDPLVQMYRDNPTALSPVYSATLASGAQSFSVSGLTNGAKVVLWQGDNVYTVGSAGADGTYSTTIAPEIGDLKLTVVAADAPVYAADITVEDVDPAIEIVTTATDLHRTPEQIYAVRWDDVGILSLNDNIRIQLFHSTADDWDPTLAEETELDSMRFQDIANLPVRGSQARKAHLDGVKDDGMWVRLSDMTNGVGYYVYAAIVDESTGEIIAWDRSEGRLIIDTPTGPATEVLTTRLSGSFNKSRTEAASQDPNGKACYVIRWSAAGIDSTYTIDIKVGANSTFSQSNTAYAQGWGAGVSGAARNISATDYTAFKWNIDSLSDGSTLYMWVILRDAEGNIVATARSLGSLRLIP